MLIETNRILEQIETEYNITFAAEVRLAIEARAWLIRLGIPFSLEGLLRSILREGFSDDSAFRGLDVKLTLRAARSTLPPPHAGKAAAIPEEIIKCIELAARICHHFSQTQYVSKDQSITIKEGTAGQDTIIFAVAHMASDLIPANLLPTETAQWIRKIARGVARRALSHRVGPSIMYDLHGSEDVREFLHKRALLRGWYVKTLLTRNLVSDGEQYVYLSTSQKLIIDETSGEETSEEAAGAHSSFCFVGVPQAAPCPDWGQLAHPIRIVEAISECGDDGSTRFVLKLDKDAARRADVPPTVIIEFQERLTVEEYTIGDE